MFLHISQSTDNRYRLRKKIIRQTFVIYCTLLLKWKDKLRPLSESDIDSRQDKIYSQKNATVPLFELKRILAHPLDPGVELHSRVFCPNQFNIKWKCNCKREGVKKNGPFLLACRRLLFQGPKFHPRIPGLFTIKLVYFD